MRFHQLDTLPPQIWFDEIWFSLKGRTFAETGEIEVFFKTFWGGVHSFLPAVSSIVYRLGLETPLASRIMGAVGGTLSLPLTYVCVNEWGRMAWSPHRRRLIAVLTTLILATLLSFVVMTRVGIEWGIATAMTVAILWLYRRAERTRQWSLWVVVGILLGVSQYHSNHMRFIIPLIVWLVVHDLWREWTGARRLVGMATLAAAVSIGVAWPFIRFFVAEPAWLTARADVVTDAGEQSQVAFLLNNAWLIAKGFVWQGAYSPLENIPNRPMFDLLQTIGFLTGLWWLIRSWRSSPLARDITLWIVLMALPSLLTTSAPSFERMINAYPALAFLVAIGWTKLWYSVSSIRYPVFGLRITDYGLQIIGLLLVIFSIVWNGYLYFGRYPHSPHLHRDFTANLTTQTKAMVARAETERVFIEHIPEAVNTPYFDFFVPKSEAVYIDFRQCLPLTDQRETRTTYFLFPTRDPQSVTRLSTVFPTAIHKPVPSESAWLVDDRLLVEVPAQTELVLDVERVSAEFEQGISLLGYEWSGENVMAGESVFVTLYWRVSADIEQDWTSFTHINADPNTPPIAQRDGQPCLGLFPTSRWWAGDVVGDSFAITIPPDTLAGAYEVIVGWYSFPSFDRLGLISAENPRSDNRAHIANLNILDP